MMKGKMDDRSSKAICTIAVERGQDFPLVGHRVWAQSEMTGVRYMVKITSIQEIYWSKGGATMIVRGWKTEFDDGEPEAAGGDDELAM
jgi:hypothetical protein